MASSFLLLEVQVNDKCILYILNYMKICFLVIWLQIDVFNTFNLYHLAGSQGLSINIIQQLGMFHFLFHVSVSKCG